MSTTHRTNIQIRFNDIDLLGHANNATIHEYFDIGRLGFLKQTIGDTLLEGALTLVIVSVKTDFANSIRLYEDIELVTQLKNIGTKSLTLQQQIFTSQAKQIKATCESVMVCIDQMSNESVIIPENWRRLIE